MLRRRSLTYWLPAARTMLAEPPHGDVNRRLMMVDTARSGPALRSGGFGTESGLAVRCAHCSRVWERCVGVTGDADLARELIASAGQCWGLDLGDGHELSRFVNTTVLRPDLGVVVRIYRPGVGVERVAALQAARRALLDADLPVVPLVASSSGHTVEFVDGRAIEVEQYVDHDGSMNTTTRLVTGAGLLAGVQRPDPQDRRNTENPRLPAQAYCRSSSH